MTPSPNRSRPPTSVDPALVVVLYLSGAVVPPIGSLLTWAVAWRLGETAGLLPHLTRTLTIQLTCLTGIAVLQGLIFGVLALGAPEAGPFVDALVGGGAIGTLGLWLAIPVVGALSVLRDRLLPS